MFLLPVSPRKLSLDVVMKSDDCSELAWTWIVEDTTLGLLQECSISKTDQFGEYMSCNVTCMCAVACGHLYVRYNRVPWMEQDTVALCEVLLKYERFTPELSQ